MPITKDGSNVIQETAPASWDEFQATGVIQYHEFAIAGTDRLQQIKFDPTALTTNSSVTIAAPTGTGGVYTLPSVAGALAGAAGVLQYAAPLAAATVTIADATTALVLEPAGTIATLTVVLPTTPADGKMVSISSTAIVSILTLSGGGSDTIVNAITVFAAAGFARYVYRASTTKWYRIG